MGRKTGVVLSYLLIAVEAFSTLLLTPLVIRILGTAEYGVYKLAGSVNAYLLLLDLGVGNAVTRFISKYRVEKDKKSERIYLGVATIYYLGIAVCALVLGGVLIAIFPSVFATGLTYAETLLGQKLLSITIINSVITLGTTAYANVVISYEKFIVSKGSVIVQVVIRMILTYITLKQGMGSIGIVSVQLILTTIFRGFFVFYVLFFLKLKPAFRGINSSFVKEIVKYSSLILLQMLATQINATVDQILMGMFVEASTVIIGVYSLGTQIVQYYQSIGSSFNGVLMPGVVRFINTKPNTEQLTHEMVRVGRILLMVLAPIWGCFLIHGKQFMVLWANKESEQGYYVAIILMTAYLFIMTESIGSQILWALNRHKEQAYLKVVIVILNVVLTIILIKWNPLIGATIGTLISLVLGDVIVMNIIFKKKLGLHLKEYYLSLLKGILPSVLVSTCLGWIITKLVTIEYCWMGFIIQVGLMVLIYLMLLIKVGMNEYEKKLVVSLFSKIIGKK